MTIPINIPIPTQMPVQQRISFTIAAILFFAFIIYLVKRRKLLEEYSWMWLIIGLGLIIYSNSYFLILHFGRAIGVVNPVSTVFYLVFVLLLFICLQTSIYMSSRFWQYKNFVQKFALLEHELHKADLPPKQSDILVIIPCYNEEANLQRVINDIRKTGKDLDILVVNDASEDQTELVAKKMNVDIISHPVNMNYGVTLQTGYRYAHKRGYQTIVQLDGDGQHHPEYIENILDAVVKDETDFVIGSRFLEGNSYKVPFIRSLGMKIFSRITMLVTGLAITDTTSGFQAFNRKVLSLFVSDVFPSDFPDADVVIMLHYFNFRIKECPVEMSENVQKKSMHQGFLNSLYYIFKMSLSIFVLIIRFTGKKDKFISS